VKASLVVEEDVLALPVALVDGKDAFDHLEKPRSAGGVVDRSGTGTTSSRRRDRSHIWHRWKLRIEGFVLLILHEGALGDLLYHTHDLRCISTCPERVHSDVLDFHQHIVKSVELLVPHQLFDQVLLIDRGSSVIFLSWSQSLH
jgi:hypothetical protein